MTLGADDGRGTLVISPRSDAIEVPRVAGRDARARTGLRRHRLASCLVRATAHRGRFPHRRVRLLRCRQNQPRRSRPAFRTPCASVPMKWVGAVIAAVAVAAVAALLLTGGTPATGTAVIDAAPWANIVEIRNEAGDVQPLPSPASTPLSLALPAGTYQISLTGPPPESKKETVTLRVERRSDERGAGHAIPVADGRGVFRAVSRRCAVNRMRIMLGLVCVCAMPCTRRCARRRVQAGTAGARRQEVGGRRPSHAERAQSRRAGIHAQGRLTDSSACRRHGVSPALLPGRGVLQPAGLRRCSHRMVDLRAAGRGQDQA